MAGRDKSTRIVRKLRETGESYRELFNSINICIAIFRVEDEGKDFIVKDLNTAVEKLEKVNRQDIIGNSIFEVFPGIHELGILEAMQRVWQTGVPEHHPARFYGKDKKTSGWRDSYVYKSPSGDIVIVYEDITERKKGEEALEEAKKRYRTVADFTYDWEFWRSPEGKMLYVSPSCERISGYPPGHFIKDRRLMDRIILPEDAEIWTAHLERIKENTEDKAIFRIRHKGGEIRWIECVYRPIVDENGNFLGTRGTNRDITDRVMADSALRDSEEKFRAIVEQSKDVIYTGDANGVITFLSPEASHIFGYTPEEMVGRHLTEFVAPKSVDEAMKALERTVTGKDEGRNFEWQLRRKDGSFFLAEITGETLTYGNSTGIAGTIRDVTAQRETERQTRESDERFITAFNTNPDPVAVTEIDTGIIIMVNPTYEKWSGYSKSELIGATTTELNFWVNQDDRNSVISQLQINDEVSDIEVQFRTKDGKVHDVQFSANLIEMNGIRYVFSRAHDITERKLMEGALRESERKYRLLAENTDDVIWTVDSELHFAYVSPSVLKLRGYTSEEAMYQTLSEMMTPDSLNRVLQAFELAVGDQESIALRSWLLETEQYHKDGTTIWSESTIRALGDDAGKFSGFIGTSRDITERKGAEKDLLYKEETLSSMINAITEAAMLIDADGTALAANAEMARHFGLSQDEIIGKTMYQLLPTDVAITRRVMVEKVITSGEPLQFEDERDGRYLLSSMYPVKGDGGKVTRLAVFCIDLTERKKAETALRLQSLLLNSTTDSVFLLDTTGNFLYFNEATYLSTGYTREEMSRMNLSDLLTPEDTSMEPKMREILEKGSATFESTRRRKDGSIWDVEVKARLIELEGRQQVLCVARDISERKKVEEALRGSEERFKNMSNLLPQTVFETNEKGNFTFVNCQGFDMFGYSEADIAAGMNVLETIIPQDRDRAMKNIGRRIKGEEFPSQEYTAVRKDGSTFPVAIYASSIIVDSRQSGMRGILVDMTERRKTEETIRESENKFKSIIEHSGDMFYMFDIDASPLYLSPRAVDMLGYSAEEFAHIKWTDLLSESSVNRAAMASTRAAIRTGQKQPPYPIEFRRKDGSKLFGEINESPLKDAKGNVTGLVGVMRDITDRKRLEEELRLVAKLESVGTLAGGIAHDFNNILGAILGNISLAKTEVPADHGAYELMSDAEKAVMRARDLTRQLLTFSKGGAPVKKRAQLQNMIIDTAVFSTRGTNVKCRFDIAEDLWPADVDEGQISQVIQNLVINARQAMSAGGDIDIASENIVLTEEMRLGRRLPLSPGKYIRITIRDYGTGIDPRAMERIFDPYFTTKKSGSGLGLATSQSIIRNHAGHISVESSPGQGSTFYIYLPACGETADHTGEEKPREAIRLQGRVLVMDDEASLRTILENMLTRLGFEHTALAGKGEEALDLYSKALQGKQPFDVVILDLTVPGGMGGQETMEKLLEIDPGVVSIISSGYANEEVMSDYAKYGFKAVIVKPYTFDELKSTMRALMDTIQHNK